MGFWDYISKAGDIAGILSGAAEGGAQGQLSAGQLALGSGQLDVNRYNAQEQAKQAAAKQTIGAFYDQQSEPAKDDRNEQRKQALEANVRKGQLKQAGAKWNSYADTQKQGRWEDLTPEQQEEWRAAHMDNKLSIALSQQIAPEQQPVVVTLENADGSKLEIKDAHLELARINSKIQKLEALVKCLGG